MKKLKKALSARKQVIIPVTATNPERRRLAEDAARTRNWKRWGPYLAERQWATVREDYSPDGASWESLPHDHARSRAYRWGENGLLGISDRQCRLCFALAVRNTRDPVLCCGKGKAYLPPAADARARRLRIEEKIAPELDGGGRPMKRANPPAADSTCHCRPD